MRRALGVLLAAMCLTVAAAPVAVAADPAARALRMADFILSLQDVNGAIPDAPGAKIVNEDSNMEYALVALGHAYAHTGDGAYLTGLENGIAWLAAREEMVDPRWKGSWRYAYSSKPPYTAVAVSPGGEIQDVRAVDATSALFVYLLWLDRQLTGSEALVNLYEPNARAALDFVLAYDQAPGGFFYSSWQLRGGEWKLWKYRYAADQGDVYLGMRAGALLYADPAHIASADFLAISVVPTFFSDRWGRFAVGMDRSERLDRSLEGFNGIFPQGYLPWIFGPSPQARAANAWLRSGVAVDGSISFAGGPAYTLSAAMVAMSSTATGRSCPPRVVRWLTTVPFDRTTGGVHDTGSERTPEYSNVAAFSSLALLGTQPFNP